MKLHRLVEMIHENCAGANDWPVMFTSYRQTATGDLEEIGVRESVTIVQVEHDEVLLIRDAIHPPLTVSNLQEQLSELLEHHHESTVDTCETPIKVEEFGNVHIDLPIVGVGRDEVRKIFLLAFVS